MVVREGERLGIGLHVETLLATPRLRSLSRPTFSMESLMSARTTWPVSPTMRENLAVRSCAASQIQHLLSLRTPEQSMVKALPEAMDAERHQIVHQIIRPPPNGRPGDQVSFSVAATVL